MQQDDLAEKGAFPCLELRLLGTFQARINGRPLAHLRTRKGQVLLALLALRAEKPVERGWLAGTLWPDSAPEQALYNLRQSLSDLRSALGSTAELLHSPTPRTLQLRLEGVVCDVLSFDGFVAQEAWEAVLALYTGPLLEDWYDDCLLLERQSREEAFRQALLALAQQAYEAQSWPEATVLLERLLTVEPQREGSWQRLMEARAASGDYAALTDTYRRFRLYLHETLSTSPSAETITLYERLRAQAITPKERALPRAGNGNLPLPQSGLIGREQDVAQLVERVQSTRMVTLTGAGGIGKTRLALAVAHELTTKYPQGVWWIELAALTDSSQVPQALASTLGLRENPGEPLAQTLQSFLQHKQLLLVLDNCEHLREGCSSLCDNLLAQCPSVHLLTTSRQVLNLSSEIAWQVPSLVVPTLEKLPRGEWERLEMVRDSASAQLFVERVQAVQRSFGLTVENALPIAQICARLEGVPLALELAAARANVLSMEQIATRLDKVFPLLTRGSISAPTRQQTLRGLIDWSYDLLSSHEKALLQCLAVFRGGWTLEAAEYLAEHTNSEDALETLDLLANLIERSLVLMETTSTGETRYRMLETIRQYAHEKLQLSAESKAIQLRHADYFLLFVEAEVSHMNGPQETRSLIRQEGEHDNLRAALRFSLQEMQDAQAGLRLVTALHPFWDLQGFLVEGLEWALAALTHPGAQQPTALRASVLAVAGNLALGQGNYQQGIESLEEGIPLCQTLQEHATLAKMLNILAIIRGRQGDLEAKALLLEESLRLYQELEDKSGMALLYTNLCSLARKRGDFETARGFQKLSLALCQELGDTRAIVWSLNNLGGIALDQANYAEAHAHFERSLSLCHEVGDKAGIADTLNDLGCIAQQRGEYAMARPYFEESLSLREERGDRNGMAVSLGNLGAILMTLGSFEQADELMHKSLDICRKLGTPRRLAQSLDHLGNLAFKTRNYPQALLHYEESRMLSKSIDNKLGVSYVLNSLGQTLCALNDLEHAYMRLIECLHLCEEIDNTRCAEYALESSAYLAFLMEQPEIALRLYSAVEVLRKTNDHPCSPQEQAELAPLVAQAHAALPHKVAKEAWQAGQSMTREAAIEDVASLGHVFALNAVQYLR